MIRAALLGVLIGCAALGLMFGCYAAQYFRTVQALTDAQECETERQCIEAWARFKAINEGKI
jgi:hypothetical protein